MSTDPAQHERRAAQRFDFHLPVSIQLTGREGQGHGFTQNLSARGAFVYTDLVMSEGNAVDLTLMMPSEILLTEAVRVRCRGRVARIDQPGTATKYGVAVQLEGYEFLPEETSASKLSERVSEAYETQREEESELAPHTFQMRGANL